MKPLTALATDGKRLALAALAGLALAAAFPKFSLAGAAWVAPALILAAAMGRGGGAAFRLGYVAGLAHCLASLHWLLFIPVTFAPIVGWLALSGFLALYPAAWVWACWKIYPTEWNAAPPGLAPLLDKFLATRWAQRLAWSAACAALWVAWEMTQARLFTGFPWNLLGASQYRMLPLIQIAAVTGVYGVSFLIVWLSVALLCAVAALIRRPVPRGTWMAEFIVPLLAVLAVIAAGARTVFQEEDRGQPGLKLALIQPGIPQTMIWDAKEDLRRFQQVIALSEAALTNRPDVLVWPEAAVPGFVRWDTNIHPLVTNFVRRHRVWLVLGADDAAPAARSRPGVDADFFNSSFLVSPDAGFLAGYRKRKLVMFGEYVPLADWLPFLQWFTPITGAFTPGDAPVPFDLRDLRVKTSVLICFEDIFPHLVRESVDDDTDFLLNLTNNGWFGESAAQWQHAANAVCRAVENGRPLVRCANNGLTCWVDAQGRLHDAYFPGTRDIYRAGFKIVRVPVLAGQRRAPTFYRRHGDAFGWGCVTVGGILLAWHCLLRRRREKASGPPVPRP